MLSTPIERTFEAAIHTYNSPKRGTFAPNVVKRPTPPPFCPNCTISASGNVSLRYVDWFDITEQILAAMEVRV